MQPLRISFHLLEEAFGLYVIPEDEKAALLEDIANGAMEGASEEAIAAATAAETELYNSMALTDLELATLEDAFEQSMLALKNELLMTIPTCFMVVMTLCQ